MENARELANKLDQAFCAIESLDLKPTMENAERIIQALYNIKDVYMAIKEEAEKEEAEHEREQTDPE